MAALEMLPGGPFSILRRGVPDGAVDRYIACPLHTGSALQRESARQQTYSKTIRSAADALTQALRALLGMAGGVAWNSSPRGGDIFRIFS